MNSRSKAVFASASLVLVLSPLMAGCSEQQASEQRQQVVREKGADVMPFDLDATRHNFVKSETGGVQSVLSRDSSDLTQVTAVRAHLREISAAFAAGNFTDPVTIHGADMPGIATLVANAGKVSVEYADVADGGQITYSSSDPIIVNALHDWFDAQLNDHGHDATGAPAGVTEEMWKAHHPDLPYPTPTGS
jgi:hypothetical protein